MARSSIDRDSVEYVKVPVTAPDGVNIVNQVVKIAVVDVNARPSSADWKTGSWEGSTAKVLVGPGFLPLAAGSYKVWVQIVDSPEIPVLVAGTISVT